MFLVSCRNSTFPNDVLPETGVLAFEGHARLAPAAHPCQAQAHRHRSHVGIAGHEDRPRVRVLLAGLHVDAGGVGKWSSVKRRVPSLSTK